MARLFLNNRLQGQDVQDQIVWKDRIINHAVQKDRESCGVFMLKVHKILHFQENKLNGIY